MNAPTLAALLALGAASAAPSLASAQSTACYKGTCVGLDTDAVGSNFGVVANLSVPAALAGVSGGEVDVAYLGATPTGPCIGFATVLPDHIVNLRSAQPTLLFEVASAADTTLLIHGPDGWRCSDDVNGTSPLIGGSWAAGTYRIWVGGYQPGHADYTLTARAPRRGEVLPPPAPVTPPPPLTSPPGAPPLDVGSANPVHGSVIVRLGDPEVVLEGRAGGSIDVSAMRDSEGSRCFGTTHPEPDHIVTLTDRFDDFVLAAESAVDTTLIVHGPHGWLCNDDLEGQDPGIAGSLPPGTYRVWVGTHALNETARYRLHVAHAAPPVALPEVVAPTYTFRGRFEELDVTFDGPSIEAVYDACQAFASRSGSLDWVDDVRIFEAPIRNHASYWRPDALCAIVALNARPDLAQAYSVAGLVEEVPFAVSCADPPRAVLERYLPAALDGVWIDDLRVNGQVSHNAGGYWTVEQAVAIVASSAVAPAPGDLVAEGAIEGVAFRFVGSTAADIQSQCVTFATHGLGGAWIDDVVVNGQTRHNGSGWWEPNDACMIVGSLVTAR